MGKISIPTVQTGNQSAAVPTEVIRLVEQFRAHREAYQSGQYNETQLRREFIDPFFEALGWDVDNKQGHAEAYKDVIHEDSIKVGGATKAPDYCFRIGGLRKFFVEAKKPSVNLKEDTSPAYQLRRYAWSAKLPLGILTDFEEFAVYDCRAKPLKTDGPAASRILYFTYESYAERWQEIASIFSREAVLKGSFDKYAESTKTKKGTAEVDSVFLKEIESWREELAQNLALRNPKLSQRELNFAVQRTIDRIIFLRICEDRGIEQYGRLLALTNGAQIYPRLSELFHRADERYNSGLFYFHKEKDRFEPSDELTLTLAIDDKLLKEILTHLYYPDSPYEFSVLPADILGQVYEQFLGKVIRLTPRHRAVVEDKPEVKKAGGVYYTPTYIVDYIVKNTVGKLLEGKKPKQVAKLKILDPACGSGSFLIGAYQYLLDWHRDWYVADGPQNWTKGRSPVLYQAGGGGWRLTTAERRRILLNNIYGVDIDPQAVEVTKLSLSLKVLEGENEQTLTKQFELFHERALPDLASNIKCGNSLIGPDFYQGKQLSLLDEEERHRINAFDWNAEFPRIFPSPAGRGQGEGIGGGFDAVIGNPPYISATGLDERQKEYYKKWYKTAVGRLDTYGLFIERGMQIARQAGYVGLIIPNKFVTNIHFSSLRELVLNLASIQSINFINKAAFEDAAVNSVIIVLMKQQQSEERNLNWVSILTTEEADVVREHSVQQSIFVSDSHKRFLISFGQEAQEIASKVQKYAVRFDRFFDVKDGIIAGKLKDILFLSEKKNKLCKKLIFGGDMGRYSFNWKGRWVDFQPEKMKAEEKARVGNRGLGLRLRVPEIFETQKIITRKTADRIIATLDDNGYYFEQTLHGSILKDKRYDEKYFLGLLNSALYLYYYQKIMHQSGTIFPQVRIGYLKELPVRPINFSDPADKAQHDRMVKLVDQMLSLNKELAAAKTPDEKTKLERQITATDYQIDQLVYELYGLTDDEIKIVEANTPPK